VSIRQCDDRALLVGFRKGCVWMADTGNDVGHALIREERKGGGA